MVSDKRSLEYGVRFKEYRQVPISQTYFKYEAESTTKKYLKYQVVLKTSNINGACKLLRKYTYLSSKSTCLLKSTLKIETFLISQIYFKYQVPLLVKHFIYKVRQLMRPTK